MAKRGPKPKPADNPDNFTDRVRGMRRRFKPAVIRVLLTWLHMQEAAYAKQAAGLAAQSLAVNRELLLGMSRRMKSIAEACATLAADAIEPWSEYRWQASTDVLDAPAAPEVANPDE